MIIGLGSGHVWLIKLEIEECNYTHFERFNLCQKYFTLYISLYLKKKK